MVTWTLRSAARLQSWSKNLSILALCPLLYWSLPSPTPHSAFCAPHFLTSPKVVSWQTEQSHDFGDLRAGRAVTHVFRFKNVSPDTILLQTVRTTCGCTAARYPEQPIAPGAIGDITVEYDAAQSGHFRKKIRVFFEQQRKAEILWISGEVE